MKAIKTTLIITAPMIALAAEKTCKGADWSMGNTRREISDGRWQHANHKPKSES